MFILFSVRFRVSWGKVSPSNLFNYLFVSHISHGHWISFCCANGTRVAAANFAMRHAINGSLAREFNCWILLKLRCVFNATWIKSFLFALSPCLHLFSLGTEILLLYYYVYLCFLCAFNFIVFCCSFCCLQQICLLSRATKSSNATRTHIKRRATFFPHRTSKHGDNLFYHLRRWCSLSLNACMFYYAICFRPRFCALPMSPWSSR